MSANWPVIGTRWTLVDHQQVEVSVRLVNGVDGQIRVVAAGLHDAAAGLDDLGGELLGEVARIRHVRAGVRADHGGAADQAVIAALAPAVEARRIVVAGVIAVAQVPDDGAVIGRLQQLAERVGDEQAVDQAGRLLARVRVDRVELGRQQLDVAGRPRRGID